MSALAWHSVSALASLIGSRKLSPVELLEDVFTQIDRVGPGLDAFIELDRDRAFTAARSAEQEIGAGRRRGPLHGIPIGIKDCIDVAGLQTTCHSRALEGSAAVADAPSVAALRAAGAVFPGKTAMHEFAIDGPDFDLPFPPGRNPWNRNHHPGGSSSGSGAAVAGGLLPAAIGTDAGGSVRHPASACGIVGLKPTYDLVSRDGAVPLAPSLDHIGPLCRSVADAALLLDGLTGLTDGRSFGSDLEIGPRGLRVGFVRHFHEQDLPADRDTAAALEAVAATLAAEGCEIIDVRLAALGEFAVVNRTILLAEAWASVGPLVRSRPEAFGPKSRRRLLAGAFLSASDYINAQRRRAGLVANVDAVFADVDVLLVASSMCPASRIDDDAELERTYGRQARGPFNLTGHPALAMMAGLSPQGMPLSVQFVGRYWNERTLLRLARGYERVTPWHDMRPPDGVEA